MACSENLINLKDRSPEERKKISEMGHEANRKRIEERKSLKNTIHALLDKKTKNGTFQENICIALINKALKGDTKAFELIRDTIGEKEPEKINAVFNQDLGLIEKYISDAEKGVFNENKKGD